RRYVADSGFAAVSPPGTAVAAQIPTSNIAAAIASMKKRILWSGVRTTSVPRPAHALRDRIAGDGAGDLLTIGRHDAGRARSEDDFRYVDADDVALEFSLEAVEAARRRSEDAR